MWVGMRRWRWPINTQEPEIMITLLKKVICNIPIWELSECLKPQIWKKETIWKFLVSLKNYKSFVGSIFPCLTSAPWTITWNVCFCFFIWSLLRPNWLFLLGPLLDPDNVRSVHSDGAHQLSGGRHFSDVLSRIYWINYQCDK